MSVKASSSGQAAPAQPASAAPTTAKKKGGRRSMVAVIVLLLLIALTVSLGLNVVSYLGKGQDDETSSGLSGNSGASSPSERPGWDSYSVTWKTGTGYQIQVRREASPRADAFLGDLESGCAVYTGDILSVSYTPAPGYQLTEVGVDSVTVTGDITSADIYATPVLCSYTYNIIHQSVNGTLLGTDTATFEYGTTNPILPKTFPGYVSPGYQSVTWDTTEAKTILLLYTPQETEFVTKSDLLRKTNRTKLEYSATVFYQNRTATSVDICVSWTTEMSGENYYNEYGQWLRVGVGSVSTGDVEIVPYGAWKDRSYSTRSKTVSTPWITVPLSTTNATTVDLSIYYYQANNYKIDLTQSVGTSGVSAVWTIPIPAY